MNWPTHTDYQDSIQNPGVAFQEPTLKQGEIVCDMLGLPRVMSGNFASVYEMRGTDGRWAIRCFVRQVPGQQGRYARLSQYLNGLTLPYLVNFEYLLKGILVKGEWYSIVKMKWVEGLPLNNFVEEHARDSGTMTQLAADWRTMMKELKKVKVAHGDLQHGNVMVTPNKELRLVDYDGMYAPVFGRGKSPELGHANFQHPRRTPDYYDENLDNFAGLVIYTSFLAIAKQPEIFDKFYTGDNILLLSSDYRDPMNGKGITALLGHTDPTVQQLARIIQQSCLSAVESVPDFEAVMEAMDKGTLSEIKPKVAPAPTPVTLPKMDSNPQSGSRSSQSYTSSSSSPQSAAKQTPTPAYVSSTANKESKGMPGWPVWLLGAAVIGTIAFFVLHKSKPEKPEQPEPEPISTPAKPTTTVQRSDSTDKPQNSSPTTAAVSLLGTLKGHAGAITDSAFSGQPGFLVTSAADKTIRIWDAQNGQLTKTINGIPEAIQQVAVVKTENLLYGIREDNVIEAFDLQGSKKRTIAAYAKSLFQVGLSPNGEWVAAGAADRKAIQLYSLKSGSPGGLLAGHSSWVKSVSFSPDSAMLAVLGHDESVKIWSIPAGQAVSGFNTAQAGMTAPEFSADHNLVLMGEGKTAKIYNTKNGAVSQMLTGHTDDIKSAAFNPAKRMVATGSADKTIKIWDFATGALITTLQGHAGAVTSLSFSSDGKFMASGGTENLVKLWQIQ